MLAACAVRVVGAQDRGVPAITVAGRPAQLDIRAAGDASIRVTLRPQDVADSAIVSPALADRAYPAPALSLRAIAKRITARVGSLTVEVRPGPLTVVVTGPRARRVQRLVFEPDGSLSFDLDDQPVLGMGEGAQRPDSGTPWRKQPIQFDRRGRLYAMEPRWQSGPYGSRNPAAMLVGTSGWGLFVVTPWGQVDLRDAGRGRFIPWRPAARDSVPQNQRNQGQGLSKGRPPADHIVPGAYDVFVFDAHDPAALMKDFAAITGPAVLPPKWALGYMQSHRTIEDETQLLGIVDTFRAKRIPVDAVIYLGTGFAPRGWNTRQPSFTFNPDVFHRDPKAVIADMHARHVKVVVHIVPWDRDRLPTLHGSIPAKQGEIVDSAHIQSYWQQHLGLVDAGIDAFWPDEGDWFNLYERLERHRMYYEGPLSSRPDSRPWSLHRNGYPGIARWGGWVWSGDTESSWKTLEGQIAVGLNYGLSIGPFWGSDIGGFYATPELTGELYARWFQFASFCASFRAHGRTWWMRLPWGWGLSEMGPIEGNNTNSANDPSRGIQTSELNNPAIEPIARRYDELRYQLMPYTYTLAWEARATGMPLMRAMWLEYPNEPQVRALGTQYMWGRDLLIAPVFEKGATSRDVYLPGGDWYDWWTGERVAGGGGRVVRRAVDLATMPIYARAGAIIPLDPVRQYTSEPVTAPTTLRVYTGADGRYTLYDDDGFSQQYLAGKGGGGGTWTRFAWDDRSRRLTIEPGTPKGATSALARREFDIVLVPAGTRKRVVYDGARIVVDMSSTGRH